MSFFSAPTFQPKRRFRFLVSFSNLPDVQYMVKSVNKPSYTMTEKTHNVLNHIFKFPGVVKWNDVKCTFIDAKDPDVGSKFFNMLRNSGYVPPAVAGAPADLTNYTTGITKDASVRALGQVTIKQLDGGGIQMPADPGLVPGVVADTNVLEEWVLKNAFIKGVQFGEGLDYGSEEITEVSIDLVYDYAEIIVGGTLISGT